MIKTSLSQDLRQRLFHVRELVPPYTNLLECVELFSCPPISKIPETLSRGRAGYNSTWLLTYNIMFCFEMPVGYRMALVIIPQRTQKFASRCGTTVSYVSPPRIPWHGCHNSFEQNSLQTSSCAYWGLHKRSTC